MVLALAQALRDQDINYQQKLHVTAIDIDSICVHMTYIQLALLHIPAIVIHGDSLAMESWSTWYTPAHVIGLWGMKLRRQRREREAEPEPITVEAEEVVEPIEEPPSAERAGVADVAAALQALIVVPETTPPRREKRVAKPAPTVGTQLTLF
jgi:hypothetical protein